MMFISYEVTLTKRLVGLLDRLAVFKWEGDGVLDMTGGVRRFSISMMQVVADVALRSVHGGRQSLRLRTGNIFHCK